MWIRYDAMQWRIRNMRKKKYIVVLCIFLSSILTACTVQDEKQEEPIEEQIEISTDTTVVEQLDVIREKYGDMYYDETKDYTFRDVHINGEYYSTSNNADIGILDFETACGRFSEYIVKIRILDEGKSYDWYERYDETDDFDEIETEYTAEVIESYYGDINVGDIINVYKLGGVYNDILYYPGFTENLQKDKEYIAYLDFDDSLKDVRTYYYILSIHGGLFEIGEDGLLYQSKNASQSANVASGIEEQRLIEYSLELKKYYENKDGIE